MVIVMILNYSFVKKAHKVFFCSCNDCFSFFTRRAYQKSYDTCISCSNKRAAIKNTIHGYNNSNSRLHVTWANMKRRCLDPTNKKYHLYGGAGITICDKWLDFIPFMNWANLNGYKDNLTIDRIENNKGYYPDNCRFVNISTQNANKKLSKKNKSGFIGVFKDKVGKFNASVRWENKQYHVGRFVTAKDAAIARDNYIILNNLPHTLNFTRS